METAAAIRALAGTNHGSNETGVRSGLVLNPFAQPAQGRLSEGLAVHILLLEFAMKDRRQERRLTTILSADVVGYSDMMNREESATLQTLQTLRRDVMDPKITLHRGHTIKLMGDGSLVEFASVVDALRFAVDFQHAMLASQSDAEEANRIRFRIGINIGDVIVEGDDIYGDGVNIAARIEGLADPNGVCVSRSVFELMKPANAGFEIYPRLHCPTMLERFVKPRRA